MALEEDIPDQPDDKTIPKYKQIDKVTKHSPHPPHHQHLFSLLFQNILPPAPLTPYPTA